MAECLELDDVLKSSIRAPYQFKKTITKDSFQLYASQIGSTKTQTEFLLARHEPSGFCKALSLTYISSSKTNFEKYKPKSLF